MGNKLKLFFFEIISFGSPRAVVFNLLIILFILFLIPSNLVIYSPVKCVFKHVIFPLIFKECPTSGFFKDCDCPGCGLTRGMQRLLHGDIAGALMFNRFVIIVFLAMLIVLTFNAVKMVKAKE